MQHLVPTTTQLSSAAANLRSQSAVVSYRNAVDGLAPPQPREKSPIDIQIEYLKSKIEVQKARERTSHQVSTQQGDTRERNMESIFISSGISGQSSVTNRLGLQGGSKQGVEDLEEQISISFDC